MLLEKFPPDIRACSDNEIKNPLMYIYLNVHEWKKIFRTHIQYCRKPAPWKVNWLTLQLMTSLS